MILPPLSTGRGLKLRKDIYGFAVSATDTRKTWTHPWTVTSAWSPRGGKWVAAVKAGFVNGVAPVYRTDTREQQDVGRDFGINPLTGLPFFSSNIFTQAAVEAGLVEILDIPIYLGPAIPLLHFRSLGEDGFPGNTVPPYFLQRGVQAFATQDPADPRDVRRLRAIDVILHQPRLALTSAIDIADGLFSGTSIVRQVLSVRAPEANDVLRVYSGNYAAPSDVVDPLAEQYDEPAWDELPIATVFLLSPRGEAPGSEPDQRWTAYVSHNLFWNLHWAPAPILDAPDTHTDVPFIIPLAGGVAQPIVSTILAAGEDLNQQALNMINGHSLAGVFWTCTGGGHEAVFPPDDPKAAQTTGLNKEERILAQARAEVLRRRALQAAQSSLDPAFPYTAVGFDPARLLQ